jgi:saccharopine dehydrogenase-like NADP-dependent oxidoreductase
VTLDDGREVVPLKVVKALLPDPQTLAAGYTGKTCIGNVVKGTKDGKRREMFIYQVSDHEAAYARSSRRASATPRACHRWPPRVLIARATGTRARW